MISSPGYAVRLCGHPCACRFCSAIGSFNVTSIFSQHAGLRAAPMRRQLAALGVAASWRLGRWDLLERYLPAAEAAGQDLLDGGDRWEVRLGRLLSAVSKGETTAFQEQVWIFSHPADMQT